MSDVYFNDIKPFYRLDCSWQLCPVPILMTEETLPSVPSGQVLEVVFTDPGARPDLEAWSRATGHAILGFKEEKIKSSAFIRKK